MILAEFTAPWSRTLRVTTAGTAALLLAIALIGSLTGPRQLLLWRFAVVILPALLVLAALPFAVMGYVLTEEDIEVRRLGWRTQLPLNGLIEVTGEPQGLRGAVRVLGNGGLFAFNGWFWSRRLGRFHAYATDPERVVLLRYRDGRKVVVTPGDVQHFIVRVRTQLQVRSGQAARRPFGTT
jgi:hypothetical protein